MNPQPYVAVISAHRPRNVEPTLRSLEGLEARWYVGRGDTPTYAGYGARVAAEAPLCEARNLALRHAFAADRPCIQVSDDLKRVRWTDDGEQVRAMELPEAVALLVGQLQGDVHLAGVAPTDNAFFYPSKPVSYDKFIVGDLFAVAPCSLRFDEALPLKEDYDYTAQHLKRYGKVARVNGILASFAHRSNKGGAVDYRTEELERKAIDLLKRRWPGWIFDNPRRPNEVLLRYAAQQDLFA